MQHIQGLSHLRQNSFILCAVPRCIGLYNTQSLKKTSALVIFCLCVLPLKLLHLCYKCFAACALHVCTISTHGTTGVLTFGIFSVQMSQQAQNSEFCGDRAGLVPCSLALRTAFCSMNVSCKSRAWKASGKFLWLGSGIRTCFWGKEGIFSKE